MLAFLDGLSNDIQQYTNLEACQTMADAFDKAQRAEDSLLLKQKGRRPAPFDFHKGHKEKKRKQHGVKFETAVHCTHCQKGAYC